MALGLIIPLGVQNIFIFNQAARHASIKKALPSIITASICDSVLICLAVFGLSLLILQIGWLKLSILIIGFIFLIYMGYHIWNQPPIDLSANSQTSAAQIFTARKQILFAISVSIFNPHAIMDTIVVIGTSAIKYQGAAKIIFTVTCIIISWIWFFTLAILGYKVRRLNKGTMVLNVINKMAAIMIWSVALYIGTQIYGCTQVY